MVSDHLHPSWWITDSSTDMRPVVSAAWVQGNISCLRDRWDGLKLVKKGRTLMQGMSIWE